MKSENNALFFLLGAAVGVGAAILFAPYSGAKTRQYLRDGVQDGLVRAKQSGSKLAGYVTVKTDDMRNSVSEGLDKAAEAKASVA